MWDYHVILALKPRVRAFRGKEEGAVVVENELTLASDREHSSGHEGAGGDRKLGGDGEEDRDQAMQSWVYDFDSKLQTPCGWEGEPSLVLLSFAESRANLCVILTSRASRTSSPLYTQSTNSNRIHWIDISVRPCATRVRTRRADSIQKVRKKFPVLIPIRAREEDSLAYLILWYHRHRSGSHTSVCSG